MRLPLVVFFSAVVLHSASAGGVYCAETARARAAALGLEYPGKDGAPDLLRPPDYGMDLGTYSDSYPELDKTETDTVYYWENPPELSSHFTMPYHTHDDAFERSSSNYDPYEQSPSHFEPVSHFPSGWYESNHKFPFVELKHDDLPTATPTQADLETTDPENKKKPLFFFYNEPVRDADESSPNKNRKSLSGTALTQSTRPPDSEEGLKEVPETVEINTSQTAPKKSQSPVVSWSGKPRYPNQFVRNRQRNLGAKPFPRGNPHLSGLFKPGRRKFKSN